MELDDPQIIHRRLQESFDELVALRLLECAAERDGITVSSGELDAALPADVRDELRYRESWEPILAIPRAALRVLNGEPRDRVYAEDLAKWRAQGVTPASFDHALRVFTSREQIEQFLTSDPAHRAREHLVRTVRDRLIADEITRRLATTARQQRRALDEVKDEYWRDLLKAAQFEIFDSQYKIRSWKGVF